MTIEINLNSFFKNFLDKDQKIHYDNNLKTCKNIGAKIKEEINKQGLYGKVRANSAGCLDFCEQGPTLVIYPEGVWYRITDIEKDVKEILHSHCKNNNIVKRCIINLD